MDLSLTFQQLTISVGLGLLVGLQREAAASKLAGIRTFPLIALLGSICALLAQSFGGWIVAAGLVALAALVFIGRMSELKKEDADPGLTTEVAMLLMFAVGAYIMYGYRAIAVAVGAGAAVLLQFKVQMHGLAARLGEEDLKAIMKFALISMVILPALPDQTYGPYDVLNPRQVWWMVVLIVGIGLAGYIVYKFFGERAGLVLGGMLGGLISSTATTVSYARGVRERPRSANLAAVVIMIASTVVFARIVALISVVSPSFLKAAVAPIAAMFILMAALSGAVWLWGRGEKTSMPEQENPSQLRYALVFGAVYAVVLFAVAAGEDLLGNRGLYLVAGLSGLTDVDAITLSTSQLVSSDRLAPTAGWRLILIATMSNLVFKGVTVAFLGTRKLLRQVGLMFSIAILGGLLILLLWPTPQ